MMYRLRLLFWIGLVTLFLPFFGIRENVRGWLVSLAGAVIIWLSFSLRRAYKNFKSKSLEG